MPKKISVEQIADAVYTAFRDKPHDKCIRLRYSTFEEILKATDTASSKVTIKGCWSRFANSVYCVSGYDYMHVPSEIVINLGYIDSTSLSVFEERESERLVDVAEAFAEEQKQKEKQKNKKTKKQKNIVHPTVIGSTYNGDIYTIQEDDE